MLELNAVNITHVIASALLFLGMWVVLGQTLLKPFFNTVYEREQKTAGSDERANEKREEGRRMEEHLRVALQEARLDGLRSRDSRVQQAKKEAQGLRDAAAAKAAQEAARVKEELEQLRQRSLADLDKEVENLSSLLVNRVLEKPLDRVIH